MGRRKYGIDKFLTKISHEAGAGIAGDAEYDVKGENAVRVITTFTSSGTLTIQARIEGSNVYADLGTLVSGGDSDTFDVSTYDIIRFNFTVAAGSAGEIAASGFFKGFASGGNGVLSSFTIIQPDVGTSPTADTTADTLTLTSSDGSVTVSGSSITDTIDFSVTGNSFEYVSKNIRTWDAVLAYTSGDLTSITYSDGVDTIVKTFNYTTGTLTSIVLSGDTPAGIDLTKTFTYTTGDLTGIGYS